MIKHLAATCLAVAALAVSANTADPHDGRWQLNVNKSDFGENAPPKEISVVISEDESIRHVVVNIIDDEDVKVFSLDMKFPLAGGSAALVMNGNSVESSVEVVSLRKWIVSYARGENGGPGKMVYEVRDKELHVISVDREGTATADRVFDRE